MAHLLLIDDDPDIVAEQVRSAFPSPDHQFDLATSGADGLRQIAAKRPDVVLLDLRLPDQSGLEVYQQIRHIDARISVIFITTAIGADAAIEAMQLGAFDYLFKPLDLRQLRRVVGEALDVTERMRKPAVLTETNSDLDVDGAIIGNCPAMRDVYKAIGRVANQDVSVLITGETGTGKELVARAIYQHSHRSKGLYLALNCAAIPENLLESELFGHEKGAFTGADRRRIGKFEQCNGGTIFLDEIGDMPLPLQAKMLRLLQEQSFERVGGNETIRTDVRLIAATHHNLTSDSAEGKFRSDLYYRLSGFAIHLPPLRERGQDLALLANYFLRQISRDLQREINEISAETMDRLQRYSWPGNVRELRSILKQALLQSRGAVLLPAFLPKLNDHNLDREVVAAPTTESFSLEALLGEALNSDNGDLYAEAHRQLDRLLLARVLADTGGNQHQAALRLGIARETLRRRLRELGLQVTRQLSLEGDDPQ